MDKKLIELAVGGQTVYVEATWPSDLAPVVRTP